MSFALVVDMLFDRWTSYGVISNHLFSLLCWRGVKMYLHPWAVSTWLHPDLRGCLRWPHPWELPPVKKGCHRRSIRMSGSDFAGDCYYNMLADTPPCAESRAAANDPVSAPTARCTSVASSSGDLLGSGGRTGSPSSDVH